MNIIRYLLDEHVNPLYRTELLDTGVFCFTREDLRGFLTILLHLHQRWKPRRSKICQTPVPYNNNRMLKVFPVPIS